MAEIRKLLTYKVAAKITYKNSMTSGTMLLKIKSVNERGRLTAEVKGIKGLNLSGLCTNSLPVSLDEQLKDTDTFDFGDGLEPQKLSCNLGVNVKDGKLTDGFIILFSVAKKKMMIEGEFTVLESIPAR